MIRRLSMIGLVLAMTSGIAVAKGDRERGWLGIYLGGTSKVLQNQLGLVEQSGIVVLKVIEDTPAQRAGLQANDILVAIDDQPVDGVKSAVELIGGTSPGYEITLTILRDGAEQKISVVLGSRPATEDLEMNLILEKGCTPGTPNVFGRHGAGCHGELSKILKEMGVDGSEGIVKIEVMCEEGEGTVKIERDGEVETREFDCGEHGQGNIFHLKKLWRAGDEDGGINIRVPHFKMMIPKIKDLDLDIDVPDFDFDDFTKQKFFQFRSKPKTQFKVTPDGQITVTVWGEDELILIFENEEDLEARRPDLMEKYQDLMGALEEE